MLINNMHIKKTRKDQSVKERNIFYQENLDKYFIIIHKSCPKNKRKSPKNKNSKQFTYKD